MSFDDTLERLRKAAPEVRDAALIGLDGVVVARVGDGDPGGVEAAAAALADLLKRAVAAHRAADLGDPAEIVMANEGSTVVVRAVGSEYAVLVLVDPGGLTGRARHAVRMAAGAFEPELA